MKPKRKQGQSGGTCPHCGEEHALKWNVGFSGSREEPEEPAGWECEYCGEWADEEDRT